MSIITKSKFLYGFTIDDDTQGLSFNEGGSELVATILVGEYTFGSFATAIANALTTAGSQTYSVSVERDTRTMTVSATSTFSLLVSTGSNAGIFAFMGFTGADRVGDSSYVGDSSAGSEYIPQYLLQQYISTDHYKEAVSASINESGSGNNIQIVSYGTRQFMECNIKFATNINQGTGNPIETNLNGVENLVSFMDNITGKTKLEFIPDINLSTTYESFILESTPSDKNGIGYKLKELYSMKLPNYYQTGTLKFRKIQE